MINRDTVVHIAGLAELSLEEDEIGALTADLATIVRYVEQLSGLDTEGIPAMRAVTGVSGWRQDDPGPCLTREQALAAAPQVASGPTGDGFGVPPFLRRG